VFLEGKQRGPWLLVDIQRAEDIAKQRRWLAGAAVLYDTRGVMGDVVVITHDAAVALWAADVAHVEGPGGTELWLRPVVVKLTLDEVDALLAEERSDLAVMASWAVHDQKGPRAKAVVRAAVSTINKETDSELRQEMLRAMISMLGETLAREIEEFLMTPLPIQDSPVYTRIVQTLEARGEARGKASGKTDALLKLLSVRSIVVDDATRENIVACMDIATIDRWFERAITATTLEEIFVKSDTTG
jgi:hypothetical protein